MFTQCPECQIAFRVSAKILQQAGGNVRCGNCSHAFNALHYLSEEMPEQSGLEDDDAAADESPVDDLAETSRRLLETLDELAGPDDVRIEDTGIEWRVLDETAEDDADPVLTDSNTDERRYDDDTGIIDLDGDDEEDDYSPPIVPQRRSEDHIKAADEFDERQRDLALSNPEDWTDLLDEVRDPETESFDVAEELAAIHTELSGREEIQDPVKIPVDLDTQFETQAEAMGLDIGNAEDELTDEVPQLDESEIDLFDGGVELAGDSGQDEESDQNEADEETGVFELENEDEDDEEALLAEDEPEDEDDEEALLAEDESEDEDDEEALLAEDEPEDEKDYEFFAEEELEDGEPVDKDEFENDEESVDEEDDSLEATLDEGENEDQYEEVLQDLESTGEFEEKIDAAARAFSGELSDIELDETEDGDPDDSTAYEEEKSTESGDIDDLTDDTDEDVESAETEHEVPEPTTEEMTVNMEIDEELMAAADKKEDFTATLIGMDYPEQLFDENSDEVETIIMEGEFVRSAIEQQRHAAENAARSELDDPTKFADTYATSRDKLRGGRRRYDPPAYGMVIAVVALALALAGQFVHNSRESLATYGFFNQTIAPVYRILGSPVTPDWDIKGWQFEATNGSVGAEETSLTIVSRIGNKADEALPYPLIHVSLTNRFEDIMGSRILEPGEYLAGDLDPSSPVKPGENFTAVITIEEPAPDATGFKLNVCYRVEPGTVRCAIEDFK
jgi:predicted Zn finger-like uncharacterized protein